MFRERRVGPSSFFAFEELEQITHFVHVFTSRKTDSERKDAEGSSEVASSKRLLLQSLGIESDQLVFLRQVHSARVVTLDHHSSRSSRPQEVGPADGVITMGPDQFPVLRTADCLPILVISPDRGQVCALHAGWRGTRDRITEKGVNQFLELTEARPQELLVSIGPSIRKCCYQVGPEVIEQYARAGHQVERLFEGTHLDLLEANVRQLHGLGVRRVLDSGICTRCRSDLFHSHRSGDQVERMWTLAGFRR